MQNSSGGAVGQRLWRSQLEAVRGRRIQCENLNDGNVERRSDVK